MRESFLGLFLFSITQVTEKCDILVEQKKHGVL